MDNKPVLHEVVTAWTVPLFIVVIIALVAQNISQFLILPVLTNTLGKRLKFMESLQVGAVSSFLSAIGPLQAGLAYKAVFLKLYKQFSASDIVGLILMQKVLRILLCVTGATWGWLMLEPMHISLQAYELPEVAPWVPSTLLVLLVFIGLVIAAFSYRNDVSRINSFFSALKSFHTDLMGGLARMLEHPGSMVVVIVLHALNLSVNALVFYLLLQASGYMVPIGLLVVYSCIKYLANIVTILPANLGVSELLTGMLAIVLGADIALGIAIALQVRILNLLLLALASGVLMFVSGHNKEAGADA
jgi:uncharacterized membrane protein YbhN (UPF0104 family)